MVKEKLNQNKFDEIIYKGELSSIVKLDDGRYLKLFNRLYLEALKFIKTSLENKLFDTKSKKIKEINKPLSAIYSGSECIGYTMEQVLGKSLVDYFENFTLDEKSNLTNYLNVYAKIEDVVRRANEKGIIFPDLATLDNIFIKDDGSLSFIDYDGLQFGKGDATFCISSVLGDQNQYLKKNKFSRTLFNFTDELDKKSLALILFLTVFNKNLGNINKLSSNGIKVTYEELFKLINLDDLEFQKHIMNNMSDNIPGTFLTDDLERLSKTNDMFVYTYPVGDIKILRKK